MKLLAAVVVSCGIFAVFALSFVLSTGRPTQRQVPLGDPRSELDPAQLQAFTEGRVLFITRRPEIGPHYFATTCGECHFEPTLGGSGDMDTAAYIGSGPNGGFIYWTHAMPGWVVPERPPDALRRVAPPLYGLGLVERIPDATIRRACNDSGGRFEPAKLLGSTPNNKVARFGYKSYLGTLPDFIGDVLRGAMGITSEVETTTEDDSFPDPEVDRAYVESLANYVRGLAPPSRAGNDTAGEALFDSFGCATCHIPDMPPAYGVYSDLCLHRMGDRLADGITDHGVLEDELRTQPLWGLRHRKLLLHDGSAASIEEAILAHGGSAARSVELYRRSSDEERAAVLRFLGTL